MTHWCSIIIERRDLSFQFLSIAVIFWQIFWKKGNEKRNKFENPDMIKRNSRHESTTRILCNNFAANCRHTKHSCTHTNKTLYEWGYFNEQLLSGWQFLSFKNYFRLQRMIRRQELNQTVWVETGIRKRVIRGWWGRGSSHFLSHHTMCCAHIFFPVFRRNAMA